MERLKSLAYSKDFERTTQRALGILSRAREQSPDGRVGFVSGRITSGEPIRLAERVKDLARYTRYAKRTFGIPIFCALDFAEDEIAFRFSESAGIGRRELSERFWTEILESGLVTDIIMAPGWRLSKGATKEYATAKRMGLRIYHIVRKQQND